MEQAVNYVARQPSFLCRLMSSLFSPKLTNRKLRLLPPCIFPLNALHVFFNLSFSPDNIDHETTTLPWILPLNTSCLSDPHEGDKFCFAHPHDCSNILFISLPPRRDHRMHTRVIKDLEDFNAAAMEVSILCGQRQVIHNTTTGEKRFFGIKQGARAGSRSGTAEDSLMSKYGMDRSKEKLILNFSQRRKLT